jgi:hypothetical protein
MQQVTAQHQVHCELGFLVFQVNLHTAHQLIVMHMSKLSPHRVCRSLSTCSHSAGFVNSQLMLLGAARESEWGSGICSTHQQTHVWPHQEPAIALEFTSWQTLLLDTMQHWRLSSRVCTNSSAIFVVVVIIHVLHAPACISRRCRRSI